MIMGGVVFMSALMHAPKKGFEEGGSRLAARVETQIATGTGFKPFTGGAGDDQRIPWIDKE